ncbi:MAG: pyruvate dehydrogenase complex dihydrolipoamide acetyltransferase, partial [Nitratireductor sp.]|nr:pyruvate dehydrogenase complex dihydrolipoamide acetyltransferase [Nitratireductor sp.]
MAVEVILPKVDMDMATGRISSWHVEEGATVKKGDLLFEIETDKAAMEIDSPAAGIVRNITGKEGVDIAVGEVVAWIYEEGEAVADAPASAPAEAAAEAPAKAEAPAPVEAAAPVAAAPAATAETSSGVRASPLARRLAKEAGLDLAAISGSGPKGRIVKADVEAAAKDGGAKAAAAPSAAPSAQPAMSDDQVMKLFEEGSYE